ncbi:MAG: DUF1638 domain-containing protein [Thermodesulfobacteriota bacterium]|nr:DUF1638 domain-containing protein [Thermodesulfobacteriota bacterium]
MEQHIKEIERLLLICCSILQSEIETLIAQKKIEVDTIFLSKRLHDDPQKLHQALSASLQKHYKRKPIVVYGNLCLGSEYRMHALMNEYGTIKVNALNCIDCLLGGHGKVVDIDPDHRSYFLTPGFIESFNEVDTGNMHETRRLFKMLRGIILLDSLDNTDQYREDIDYFCNQTGLPIVKHIHVGLSGLKAIINEALERTNTSRIQRGH